MLGESEKLAPEVAMSLRRALAHEFLEAIYYSSASLSAAQLPRQALDVFPAPSAFLNAS